MLFLRFCSTCLIIPVIIDSAHSVLTQKNRGSRSTVDDVLILDKKSEEQFSLDLNDDTKNISSGLEDKGDSDRGEQEFTASQREFGKKKKSRTFLGPLSLDFKDKFNPKRGIIYDTRDRFGGGFISGFSCCGSKYGSPSYSDRPEYSFGGSYGGGRYSSRPSERPGNRYGPPSSSYPFDQNDGGNRPGGIGDSGSFGGSYPSRYEPPRGNYGGSNDGDRYGNSRPGYGSEPSSISTSGGLYGRPSFSISGSGGYGGQGGSYGGNGFGGSAGGYGGYGSGGGGQSNYGGSAPGGLGIGGHGGSGYGSGAGQSGFGSSFGSGVSSSGPVGFGGFGSSDGFGGGGDYGYGEGGTGHGNPVGGNIQTQKALALKALAGVALIGAAAALATNPVLLPLGVAHGRKKRSAADDFWNEHPLMLLKAYISQIRRNDIRKEDIAILSKFLASRKCVARLACEVQRDYYAAFEHYEDVNDRENSIYYNLENRFMDLVKSNILNNSYVNGHFKEEIKLALTLGARRGNCDIFPCIRPKG